MGEHPSARAAGHPGKAWGAETPPRGRALKVVVMGGHPGDPEYGCGGAIARYTDLGHDVVLLYLNRGDGGYRETPGEDITPVRVAEATRACAILGARAAFADQLNGRAVVDRSHYDSFFRLLVAEQPDVLFTHWPLDGHRDHRATFSLAYDAWLTLGKACALYFYEVTNGPDTVMFAPTHYVDITGVEPRKRAACYAHASVTPDAFYAVQAQVTTFRGVESGWAQAEGYIRHVQSPYDALPQDL